MPLPKEISDALRDIVPGVQPSAQSGTKSYQTAKKKASTAERPAPKSPKADLEQDQLKEPGSQADAHMPASTPVPVDPAMESDPELPLPPPGDEPKPDARMSLAKLFSQGYERMLEDVPSLQVGADRYNWLSNAMRHAPYRAQTARDEAIEMALPEIKSLIDANPDLLKRLGLMRDPSYEYPQSEIDPILDAPPQSEP